jgi:hypothetical protein
MQGQETIANMRLAIRILLFSAGVYLICLSAAQLRAGHMVFSSDSYHQPTFSASGLGVGAILVLVAFLPPKEWVYSHITTRKRFPRFSTRRHTKHQG